MVVGAAELPARHHYDDLDEADQEGYQGATVGGIVATNYVTIFVDSLKLRANIGELDYCNPIREIIMAHDTRTDEEKIASLVGKTLVSAERASVEGDDQLILITTDGLSYCFYHSQDCCESVSIEDICGDLADLVGSPITQATETSNQSGQYGDSETWTFYGFATNKGSVTVRWLGSSNGYYSEYVDLKISENISAAV